MMCERRVKVKLDLTLQQPFTNVVINLLFKEALDRHSSTKTGTESWD
jgi:hypothetical protein